MSTHALELRSDAAGVDLWIHVQPRASRESLGGVRAGALLVRVHAPPVEGEANSAVCRLLARALGVAPGAVHVAGGERSRRKRLRVDGQPEPLRERLLDLARGERAV